MGLSFNSLQEVVDYYATKGFVKNGQFEKSQWPARIVYVKEGTDSLQFTLKKGPRHSYGNPGYQMRAVSLEDASGGETIVVLRSKNKVTEP